MKKISLPYILSIFSLFALLSACSKDTLEEDPASGLVKLAEAYATGAATKVEVYGKGPVKTGYTPFSLMLIDSISGQPVQEADIMLMPMMDMGTMKHSSPFENPASRATKNLFPCAVVFTMPSGESGSWTLTLSIKNKHNNKAGSLTLPVTVTEPPYSRLKTFSSKIDNAKFIVAYIEPAQPKVGVNEMQLAVYKKISMMSYPADSSLSVSLIPEMPSMGHGSPNNVDPVHIGKGHYRGKVNFTMTGLWQLNLDFRQGAALADDNTFFEVNF